VTPSIPRQALFIIALTLPGILGAAPAGASTTGSVYRCAVAGSESTGAISGEEILSAQSEDLLHSLGKRGFSRPAPNETTDPECRGFIQSIVIFDRPRRQTLDLLTQTERQMEFLPNLRNVQPVARHAGESLDHHEIRIIFTKLEYRVRNHWSDEEWTMWWHLEPGYSNDMASLDGYWRFYELSDGRTLAIYASRIDVGPLVPARMQAALSRKKLEDSLRHFRSWVNSGGSYRP
jgi:hypothetical protein